MAEQRHFTVTGMSCGHCEQAVRDELDEVDGIAGIEVSAAKGTLTVTIEPGSDVDDDDIIDAVDEAGYEASRA